MLAAIIALASVFFTFAALCAFLAGRNDPVEKARDDLAYGDIAQLPTDVFPHFHTHSTTQSES